MNPTSLWNCPRLETEHREARTSQPEATRSLTSSVKRLAAAALLLGLLSITGCSSTDESGGGAAVSGGVYYGVGFYDPWYYGSYYDDVDIIVTPPDRPDTPVRPTHPIATPPVSAAPRPTPMPSIPSMPRASFRR